MRGVHAGFIALFCNDPVFPEFVNYYCVIHQQVLAGKVVDFSNDAGGQTDKLDPSKSASALPIQGIIR